MSMCIFDRWRLALFLPILLVACPALAAIDEDTAVKLSREYLAAESRKERRAVTAKLANFRGNIDAVLRRLSERTYRPVKSGYIPDEHFSCRDLRRRHPDDLLFFVVPESYRPERPTGLIVFLHGGGKTTSPRAPQATLRFPSSGASRYDIPSGDMLAATGMITVGPSAPAANSYYRWCLSGSDDYLADVILECKARFNIDPDRIFLLGHSMGGFGAYHHALRQPDRFAAVVVSSGSWKFGYWPAVRGTPLCIVQGAHDARKGVRWHSTDVEYGRWTDKILTREGLDHVYLEHEGRHGFGYGREKVAQYFRSARDVRRDPRYPHIVLASPQGYRQSFCSAVTHNRWLTLDESTRGNLTYDELLSNGSSDFDRWRLHHERNPYRGAAIEAINRGDNTIEVTTQNVARLTVWLDTKMVDIARPVLILVDGRGRFEGRVRPSLATALESYRRRQDWGLVYPIKVEVSVK